MPPVPEPLFAGLQADVICCTGARQPQRPKNPRASRTVTASSAPPAESAAFILQIGPLCDGKSP